MVDVKMQQQGAEDTWKDDFFESQLGKVIGVQALLTAGFGGKITFLSATQRTLWLSPSC